jgi:hypothetical protein
VVIEIILLIFHFLFFFFFVDLGLTNQVCSLACNSSRKPTVDECNDSDEELKRSRMVGYPLKYFLYKHFSALFSIINLLVFLWFFLS